MTSASERFGNSWKKNLLMGKNLQEKRFSGGGGHLLWAAGWGEEVINGIKTVWGGKKVFKSTVEVLHTPSPFTEQIKSFYVFGSFYGLKTLT